MHGGMTPATCRLLLLLAVPPVQGSVVLRQRGRAVVKQREDGSSVERERVQLAVLHTDLIGQGFWDERPELLAA